MNNPVFYALDESIDKSNLLSTDDLFAKVGNNTGNLAYVYAARLILGSEIKHLDWASTHNAKSNESLVISCANQLGAHCDMSGQATKLSAFDMPMIAVGLGAQAKSIEEMPAVPQGTLDWYDVMAGKSISSAPNIALRGEHTYKYLKSIGREKSAVVLGCPSNLINPNKQLGKTIKEREVFPPRRVAVAAGTPWVPDHRVLERSLADIVTLTGGSYIAQASLEMIKLARADFSSLNREQLIKFRNFLRPNLVLPEFQQWCRQYMAMFVHVPSWMEHLRKFDFVVGNRIHGVMLALQAGVPALCIAHDSRTSEMCEAMCVPYVTMDKVKSKGLSLYNLKQYYDFDPDAYDVRRIELAEKFRIFFEANAVKTTNHLNFLLK